MFKLKKYFLLVGGLIFLLFATSLVFFFSWYNINHYTQFGEQLNIAQTRLLSNLLNDTFKEALTLPENVTQKQLVDRPVTHKIDTIIRSVTPELSIVKVKLFSITGLTIYSSNEVDIGKQKKINEGFLLAAEHGLPASSLENKSQITGFELELFERDIVETYIPIKDQNGSIIAVFELYADVTDLVTAGLKENHVIFAILLIVLGIMFGVIYIIISQADKILKQQYGQLEKSKTASESRYQALFENAEDAIFVMDQEKFIDCNTATLKIFDCSRSDIIGKTPMEFSPEFQPDGSKSSEKALKKINDAAEGRSQFFEWCHKRFDGSVFDAEVSLSVVNVSDELYIMAVVRDVSERKEFESKLAFQAGHDSLTGLLNRKSLHDAFSEHVKLENSDKHVSMMLLDLDRFKEINDTLGHHYGDKVLQQVGPRLQETCKSDIATVTRLGGDEFAILLTSTKSEDELIKLAKDIIESLRQPFLANGITVNIGASLGISCYPGHGKDSHELLRAADVAMYEAKKLTLGVKLYETKIDEYSRQRLKFANDLTRAIEEKQFVLHYQPKLDIKTDSITGFEALVRWQHPEEGLLFPASFIDLIEMSDAIYPFTQIVLELAVAEKQHLHSLGFKQPLAINLSARNLLDESCYDVLVNALNTYDVSSDELELELTESVIMHDPESAKRILKMFNEMGINIAVDDFGTGYSSLSYLRQLPVSSLKIDRAFVTDMQNNAQDAAIVRSTIALAHSLELKVIAEGVEDKQTLTLLKTMHCDQAQGYGICRPQPLDGLVEWLSLNNTNEPQAN